MRADRCTEKVRNTLANQRLKVEKHQIINDATEALLENINFQEKQTQCGTASTKPGKPGDAYQTNKMHSDLNICENSEFTNWEFGDTVC